jgi:N-acetyl-1-D-myo-inositol-2-amino-2-deoxy-alpha-D-glucopyranoside deacetylase
MKSGRDTFQPSTPDSRPPRVLAVSAHPDDDTLFAGGTLAKYAAEGYEVYTLDTTRGEGGEVGEPPVGPKEQLGIFREAEARCAARALGERDIFFLDFVDPHMEIDGIALPIEATLEQFSAAIAEHLARLRPEIVITHGTDGEYGHPQHRFTHVATRAAIQSLAPWRPRAFITWMARPPGELDARSERISNLSDPVTETLDVSPWLEQKVAAAMCHRSQHAMFLRNSKAPGVREMVRPVEHLRSWPAEEYLRPVTWDSRPTATPPSGS